MHRPGRPIRSTVHIIDLMVIIHWQSCLSECDNLTGCVEQLPIQQSSVNICDADCTELLSSIDQLIDWSRFCILSWRFSESDHPGRLTTFEYVPVIILPSATPFYQLLKLMGLEQLY